MAKRKHFRRKPGQAGTDPRTGSENGPNHHAEWIYGTHAVNAALVNPDRTLERLVVAGNPPELPPGVEIKPEILDRAELGNLLPEGAVHQGIALCTQALPVIAIEDIANRIKALDSEAKAVVVVLDQVNDPRNIGAVLRSAAMFGVLAVILPERHTPDATGVLAKAASGALESVPLVRVTNLVRALGTLKDAGMWCAGLDAAADSALPDADFAPKTALVLGAEGAGLRRLTRENCDLMVRIEEAGGSAAGLNVSNAAAVALYELARWD
jgi:23S rRNA (guanosine2251-2'-O)-methyltransferase